MSETAFDRILRSQQASQNTPASHSDLVAQFAAEGRRAREEEERRKKEQEESNARGKQFVRDSIYQSAKAVSGQPTLGNLASAASIAEDYAHRALPLVSPAQALENRASPTVSEMIRPAASTRENVNAAASRYANVAPAPTSVSEAIAKDALTNRAASATVWQAQKKEADAKANPAYQAAQSYQSRVQQNDIDRKNSEIDALTKERDSLVASYTGAANAAYGRTNRQNTRGNTASEADLNAMSERIRALNQHIGTLTNEVNGSQNALDEQTRQTKLLQYAPLTFNSDFEKNSKEPDIGKVNPLNPKDRAREEKLGYIAGKMYGMYGEEMEESDNPYAYADSRENLREIHDDERKMYYYLFNTRGEAAADEYLDLLTPELNARLRQTTTEKAQKYASEHPVLSSVASVVASPAKAGAYAAQWADALPDNRVDQNAPYQRSVYATDTIRSAVGQNEAKITEDYLKSKGLSDEAAERWGKVSNFAYGTVMSMADFLFNSFMSGSFGGVMPADIAENISLALMGSEAASTAVLDAKDKGLSDDRAMLIGAVAGLAEIVTERVSVENLFSEAWEKQNLKYLIKNVVSEGSEEGASDLINWTADLFINADKNEWTTDIQNYVDDGMDKDKAVKKVIGEKIMELVSDVAGGAVSGGVMAGSRIGIGTMNKAIENKMFQTHNQLANADTNQGTDYIRTLDGLLNLATTTAQDSADRREVMRAYLDEVERAFPEDPQKRGLDYIRESRNAVSDEESKRALESVYDYFRNNRKSIMDEINSSRTAGETQETSTEAENRDDEVITSDQAEDNSRMPLHQNIEGRDDENGSDYTGYLNVIIDSAADMSGEGRINALGHLVSEMDKLFGTIQGYNYTIDYINERIRINNQVIRSTQDQSVIDDRNTDTELMKSLSDDLRNKREDIQKVVSEIGAQRYVRAKPWNRPTGGTYRYTTNRQINDAIDEAVSADVAVEDDTPAPEVVELVSAAAAETEPGESAVDTAIEAVREKLEEAQQIANAPDENAVMSETFGNALRTSAQGNTAAYQNWMNDLTTRRENAAMYEAFGETARATAQRNVNLYQKLIDAMIAQRQQIEEAVQPKAETSNETNEEFTPDYTLTRQDYTHTKTKEHLNLFKIKKNLSDEELKALKNAFKSAGGYYSSYAKGFLVSDNKLDRLPGELRKINVGLDLGNSTARNENATSAQIYSGDDQRTDFERENGLHSIVIDFNRENAESTQKANTETEQNTDLISEYAKNARVKESVLRDMASVYLRDPNLVTDDVIVGNLPDDVPVNQIPVAIRGIRGLLADVKERADAQTKMTNPKDRYENLAEALSTANLYRENGLEFSIGDYVNNHTKHREYDGVIRKVSETHVNGVPIFDARDTLYRARGTENRADVVQELVDVARNNKFLDPVDNSDKESYTETEITTEKTAAEPESEYAVGDVVEVDGEYYEVVAVENGEPQFEPYTSSETETEDSSSYSVGDIIEYNGKNYRIVEFEENGSPVLEEYRQPRRGGASNVRYALEAPERIILSLNDFNNAIKSNQIRKVSSAETGAKAPSSGRTSVQRSSPQKTQGTARLSLDDLKKKAGAGTSIKKITDKSILGGISNGRKTGSPGTGRRTGTVRPKLDAEGEGRNGGRTPDTVQETEEARGSEKPAEIAGAGRGEAGTDQMGTARRNGNTGSRVRNQESDSTAASNTVDDERNNGAGNGGRVSGSSDAGNGKRVPRLNKNNYSFDSDDVQYIDNTRPNESDNLNAIRTLLQIERAGRKATPAEQKILAKYKGWGGLPDIFRSTWRDNARELKTLLSEQEYRDARASTINAHYTSLEIVNAMYDGLARMGLKGGNILEPSMGSGNFFGAMPKSIASKSNLFGVEMDSITGRIAQQLYPDASITVAPFQDARYKDGQFDAIIGNVPFSENTFAYKGEKHTLHDYFFVKSLDHLKDGGVMMAITSTGTLDKGNSKSRDTIAKKADLIAAFRLPGGMFKTNAGTQVTTDLLVFRKRPDGLAQSGETFSGIGEIDGIPINEYFVRHPENILGELTREKGMYGSERTQAVPFADADYRNILAKAMKSLPAKIIGTDMTAGEVKIENSSIKPGFIEQDGKMYFRDPSVDKAQPLSGKKAETARSYLKIRDAYNALISLSNDPDTPDAKLDAARKTLNTLYDDFVEKYGPISKGGVGGARTVLRDDSDYSMVSALEVKGSTPGTYKKAPIFETNVFARPTIQHVDSPHDALAASISERGKIDLSYMEKLSDIPQSDLLEQLGDRIVETPDGELLLSELYLSGDVRSKLDEARRAAQDDSKFEKNVRMLEAVVPKTIPTENISVNIGASWIPESYYLAFARERLGAYQSTKVVHDKTTGQWIVEGGKYAFPFSPKYGSVDLRKMFESTMNQKQMQIRDQDGKIDIAATQDVQQKQKMLRDEFAAWVFATKDRKQELGDLYNRKFNSWRNADYTELGKTLKFEGVNPSITLRDYQRTAIARTIYSGNTLLGHGVGTGKTFEMIASAMESKRLGITHKNLFVVPKNKVADFQSDILKLYPNARVMRVTDQDFELKNRTKMISALATNDYDIAVIGHTQFAFIPLSVETERASIQEQLDEARAVLEGAKQQGNTKSRSVKQIEKTIQGLEAQLEALKVTKRDNTLPFERLGIDGLFVDEAHNFKNLPFYTSLNVPGVKGGTAKRAMDMYMKTGWLHNQHGKVVFATATPITNSMSEIYNMTRFVSPDTLKEAGIDSFDSWASIFGEVTTALEVSPDGVNFRMKDRFAKFRNAQQMISMLRQFTDILKTADVIKTLPKADRITVTSPENDLTREYVQKIVQRIDAMRGRASKKDNMLLITSDGKAAATDLRLVAKQLNGQEDNELIYLPGFERYSMEQLDLPDSKINQTVKNVLKEYKDTEDIKGTQLIFLDQGLTSSSDARYGFDLYTDVINKLIKGGIKQEEIVRIDKVPIKKLDDLFDKMRSGEVRVLIGTTMRMGEGLNIQDRIVAMHEVTPPAKPSGIEQSEGRAIRHGNMNKEVRIYRYVQEGSFDSYLWQQLERKGRFINVAMSGGEVNEIDDVDDFVLSAQEAKAIATGNPLLLEKAELDARYNDLSAAHRVYMSQQMGAQDILANAPNELTTAQKLLDSRKADTETVRSHPVEEGKISIVVDGKEYTDRKSANEALKKVFGNGKYALNRTYEIGSARGLTLKFMAEPGSYTLTLAGKDSYTIPDVHAEGENATRIWNTLGKVESGQWISPVENRVSRIKADIEEAETIVKQGFAQQEAYDNTLARLREVNTQLAAAAGGSNVEIIDSEDADFKGNFKTEEELYESELAEAEESGDEESDEEQKPKRRSSTRQSLFDGRWDTQRTDPAQGPLSVSQIQRAAGRIFNLPINTGKVNYRATGIYDERAVAARIKTHGDIPNLCHEIGHHIDAQYEFSDSRAIEEVISAFRDDLTAAGYVEEQIPGEAFAEWFRIYCKSRSEAADQFKDFTEYFENTLSDKDKRRMDDFTKMTRNYFSAVNRTRIEANVRARTEEPKDPFKINSAIEEIKNDPKGAFRVVEREAMRQWVDDLSDLKQFGTAYDKAFYEKQARSIAEGRLTVAMTDMKGNIIGDSLGTILQRGRISDENRSAFDSYLVLCRAYDQFNVAEERGSKDPLIFADHELNNKTEIAKQIQLYERENPTFKATAGEVYAYQQQLMGLCVEGGLITQEFKDKLDKLYPHYVPLYRVMDDKKSVLGVKGKYADQRAPVARFKGSGRAIWSPLENIMMDVEKITAATMRNDVMQEFANTIDRVSGLGHIATKVTPDMAAQHVMTADLKNRLATLLGENANLFGGEKELFDFTNIMFGEIGDVLTQWTPSAKQSRNIVSVMRNGERTYYEVHDEGVLRSLKAMNREEMGLVAKTLTTIGRWQKKLFTSISPKFNVNNFARDTMTGIISSSSANDAVKYMADAVSAFKDVVMDSNDFKMYKLHGGRYMNSLTYDSGTMRNIMDDLLNSKGKVRQTCDTLLRIYTASEDVTRYAEYKRQLADGKSVMEAIRASQEISVNFSRGGETGKKLNRYFLFLNAQIQGEYHVADLLKNGTKAQKAKMFLYPMAVSILQWMLGLIVVPIIRGKKKEELIDDYADLSNYQKLNYYNIPLGDKKFFQIRKTQDFALPESLVELYVLNAMDKNSGEWNDVAEYVMEQLFPLNKNSISNFVGVGPLLDIKMNESYTGAPIVPEYMLTANTPKELQYTEGSTSFVAIKLGELLNVSPNVIQYLGEEEFGFPARVINDFTRQDKDWKTGLNNIKWVADAAYSTDIINLFYEEKKKYDTGKKGYNMGSDKYTLTDVYGAEKYGKLANLYSDLNSARKQEDDTNIARAEKLQINGIFRTVNKDKLTDMDKKIIALCERTGAAPSDIAPYVTVPDSVNYKPSGEKKAVKLALNFDDHYKFFMQISSKLETAYKAALASGYSDADLVDVLKKIKSETFKEMKEAWGEQLYKSGRR